MIAGVLLALVAGFCFAIGAGLFSHVARRGYPFMLFLAIGGATGLLLALALVVDYSAIGHAARVREVCLWIICGAAANVAGHRAMAAAMARGSGPVAWAIGQASQAVPFMLAVALWGENAGALGWLGVFIILVGVCVLARARQRAMPQEPSSEAAMAPENSTFAAAGFALVAMACYGANGTLMAVPSHWAGWQDAIRLRLPLTMAVFALGGAGFSGGTTRQVATQTARLAVPYGVLLVTCFGCIYRSLDYLGAAHAAGLFWPIACSTGVASFALWEHVICRRPARVVDIAGIAAIIAGIVTMSLPRVMR